VFDFEYPPIPKPAILTPEKIQYPKYLNPFTEESSPTHTRRKLN